MRFKGKVAFITGAGGLRGIGRATALRMARDGADIALVDRPWRQDERPTDEQERNWKGMESVAAEVEALGRRAISLYADVSVEAQVLDAAKTAVEKLGRIDFLVANAGSRPGADRTSIVYLPEDGSRIKFGWRSRFQEEETMLGMWKIFGAIAGAALLAGSPAVAQNFPSQQPIKIVVAVPPGGLTDAYARVTAEFLQRRIGQSVVVENKPGASATIGTDSVAKAKPDGYTLLMMGPDQPILPSVRKDMPYTLDDFKYLVRGFTAQPYIIVGKHVPVSTIGELVAYMKANPGKVRYGSNGVGGIIHLASVMFESGAGVKGVHVPYSGVGPAYTDMLAGNLDLMVGGIPVPEGLKIIGTNGLKRNPATPDVETFDDAGLKGISWDTWFGIVAPKDLPQPIADKLTSEILAVYKDPEAIAKFNEVTKTVPETSPLVGDDFKKEVLSLRDMWKKVVDREKIVVQQ